MKYYAKQSLGFAKVIHKLAGWSADSEGSGPMGPAFEFMERTLQKLNERLEFELQTSVLLSSAWAPIHGRSNCGWISQREKDTVFKTFRQCICIACR